MHLGKTFFLSSIIIRGIIISQKWHLSYKIGKERRCLNTRLLARYAYIPYAISVSIGQYWHALSMRATLFANLPTLTYQRTVYLSGEIAQTAQSACSRSEVKMENGKNTIIWTCREDKQNILVFKQVHLSAFFFTFYNTHTWFRGACGREV